MGDGDSSGRASGRKGEKDRRPPTPGRPRPASPGDSHPSSACAIRQDTRRCGTHVATHDGKSFAVAGKIQRSEERDAGATRHTNGMTTKAQTGSTGDQLCFVIVNVSVAVGLSFPSIAHDMSIESPFAAPVQFSLMAALSFRCVVENVRVLPVTVPCRCWSRGRCPQSIRLAGHLSVFITNTIFCGPFSPGDLSYRFAIDRTGRDFRAERACDTQHSGIYVMLHRVSSIKSVQTSGWCIS